MQLLPLRHLTHQLWLVSMLALLLLSGCSTMHEAYPPYTDLKFRASQDLNPNVQGQSSPVVVRVYELSAKDVFQNTDFFSLYNDAKSVLGPDRINQTEFELQPTQFESLQRRLNENTRYIGIVVAYRDINNANWRALIPVDPDGHDTYKVMINRLSIAVHKSG